MTPSIILIISILFLAISIITVILADTILTDIRKTQKEILKELGKTRQAKSGEYKQ